MGFGGGGGYRARLRGRGANAEVGGRLQRRFLAVGKVISGGQFLGSANGLERH